MLYRQKKDTYIRNYDGVGYITSTGLFNDRCTNESGTVFLCALSRKPQTIDELVDKIMPSFAEDDVPRETILADAREFYDNLVADGFVVKGETEAELNVADIGFTYSAVKPKTIREDFTPTIQRADSSTQEFLEKHFAGKPHLSSFQIELTSKCNERCVHCYIPHKFKLYNISDEMYYSTLEQLTKMGVLSVTLSGGECMCHPKFKEYLRAAKNYDFYVNILSNLTLLDDEIISIMKEGNVSSVQTSLYSMDPAIHDFITTVKGSHARTKAAIELLVKNDIPVQISCPIMKANRKGYDEVLEYAKSLKIKAQTDYIMMAQANFDTQNLANRISIEETEELLREIIEHDIDYRKMCDERPPVSDFIAFDLERYKLQPVCGVGYDNCCITANGDVYPCAGWQAYVLGNVYKQSLKEIWENSERVKELRKITQASFPQCLECEARDYCARCLVRNYNESGGDMFKINKHFCDVAFLNKRLVEEYRAKGLI